MTGTEYRNAIMSALNKVDQTADPISTIRTLLNSCDADFPYGECEGILNTLSNNNFAQWHEYSLDNAVKFANEGIPTVGVSKKQVIVIIPDDEAAESGIVRTANSLTADERENYNFFSNTNVRAVNGWTSDIPKNQTTDGFGGWYHRGCWSEGVVGRVPRFVQFGAGPCLAYAIMSGSYNLDHSTENVNTFFNNREKNHYIDSSGNAQWQNFTKVMDFNMSYMKDTLDMGDPVVVSGNNGTYDHFVLVVAYSGKGSSKSDYTVIDSLKSASFPTTFQDFYDRFPKDTTQFKNNTYNYTYPMFIFN